MGIDTLYWGPSAWQLFHLIAFRSKNPQAVLLKMKEMLPCKFCRASTKEFVAQHPLKGDAGKWLYDIHNMVNNKLRTQCADDPNISDPGPDPSFEEVKRKYMDMSPTAVPGRDFLFSVSANYPDAPEPADMARHREFLNELADVYPFEPLRSTFKSYLEKGAVPLETKKTYMKWMYGLLKSLSRDTKAKIMTYRGYVARVNYYTSGCDRPSYRGKTCRRTKQGHRTKDRDRKQTHRVVLTGLIK